MVSKEGTMTATIFERRRIQRYEWYERHDEIKIVIFVYKKPVQNGLFYFKSGFKIWNIIYFDMNTVIVKLTKNR
jgi:hypothetical protein